jgi:large-conductance mechanosensitive channel
MKQVRKWALWLIGAVAVKIVVSNLSDSLVMPALHSVSRWVLDLASLGLASYKNGVYKRIAADDQSVSAYNAYLTVWIVYALMMFAYVVYAFYWTSGHRRQVEHALKAISDAPPNPEPEISTDALRQKLRGVLKSQGRQRLILYCFSLFLGVALVSDFISMTRLSYVTSADAHYHQVMRVVSPYLDAHERAEVESDFAQVGSRDEYVRLLSKLEGQCKAHGKTVPKFDPW